VLPGANVTLTALTLTKGQGSGIYNDGTLHLFNSIVAGNSLYNIEGDGSVTPTGVNLTSGDLLLAPLGHYGGPTMTMPPFQDSPALDGCTNGTSFLTDQRGFPRLLGAFPDIGAVEGEVIIANTPPVLTGLTILGNGEFQFGFTNLTGASFTVFGSANVALPLDQWSNLGPAVEAPPASGQFQFTDPRVTNSVSRFYRVRSP